jgi:hypothetical protein
MALDQWGHVWVTDGVCGVSEYDGLVWRVYDTTNSPLPDYHVRSVAVVALQLTVVDEFCPTLLHEEAKIRWISATFPLKLAR